MTQVLARKLLAEAAEALEAEVAAAQPTDHPIIRAHARLAARIRKALATPVW